MAQSAIMIASSSGITLGISMTIPESMPNASRPAARAIERGKLIREQESRLPVVCVGSMGKLRIPDVFLSLASKEMSCYFLQIVNGADATAGRQIDLDEVREIAKLKPTSHLVRRRGWKRDLVALSELQQEVGCYCPGQVDMQLDLWHLPYEVVKRHDTSCDGR
jgi:hypothetical protein